MREVGSRTIGSETSVKQRTLKLSKRQQKKLEQCRDHDLRPDIRERCAAVLKISAGQSAHAVAQRGLQKPRDPDTVYGWLNRYEEGGLVGLQSRRQGGNRRRPFRRAGDRDRAAATRARPRGPARHGRCRPAAGPCGRSARPLPRCTSTPSAGCGVGCTNGSGSELRSATVQQYSPDPQYQKKVRRVKRCLRAGRPRSPACGLGVSG